MHTNVMYVACNEGSRWISKTFLKRAPCRRERGYADAHISSGTVQLPSKRGGKPRYTRMQVLLVPLLDLYPVKMNTPQNPPSLFSCESGCTLTSCTSHARRGRDGFPNKGEEREKKNKIQHAGYICKFCELGHTTVPYGIRAQGHAVGTNQRGKGPPIATVRNTPHAQGRKSKTRQLVSRRGGNSKNRNFEQAAKKK